MFLHQPTVDVDFDGICQSPHKSVRENAVNTMFRGSQSLNLAGECHEILYNQSGKDAKKNFKKRIELCDATQASNRKGFDANFKNKTFTFNFSFNNDHMTANSVTNTFSKEGCFVSLN